jgi:hypothetical protein
MSGREPHYAYKSYFGSNMMALIAAETNTKEEFQGEEARKSERTGRLEGLALPELHTGHRRGLHDGYGDGG